MPFENFYEESDKFRRRWWKCVGLAILLFVGYWTFSFLVIRQTEHTRNGTEYSEDFNQKERARRVDDLCRYLPLPEEFYLVGIDEAEHFRDSTSIVYRYVSDRSPNEITPFFVIWFNDHGWTSTANGGSIFVKDKQMVILRVLKPLEAVSDYEIKCYESDY